MDTRERLRRLRLRSRLISVHNVLMTTTSSNKGDTMKTIDVTAADKQRLEDVLTQVQLHGASEDWDAIETLDVLGAIVWNDDDSMWEVVGGGLRLVVSDEQDEQHALVDFDRKFYPNSGLEREITWNCSCGKSGTISDGRVGVTFRRARSAHKRHVAAATKSAARPCCHPLSCVKCGHEGIPCGEHFAGQPGHERCSGRAL